MCIQIHTNFSINIDRSHKISGTFYYRIGHLETPKPEFTDILYLITEIRPITSIRLSNFFTFDRAENSTIIQKGFFRIRVNSDIIRRRGRNEITIVLN